MLDKSGSGTGDASPATLALWKELVNQGLRTGVGYEEARDLASEALTRSLECFDAERGQFPPFCRTVLANLIRNHWRDRKPTEPHDPESDHRHAPDDPFLELLGQEVRRAMKDLADSILADLDAEEAALFLALAEVYRMAEARAVTAAGRSLGLPPAKAWDVFRRIQRKARRHQPEFGALAAPAEIDFMEAPLSRQACFDALFEEPAAPFEAADAAPRSLRSGLVATPPEPNLLLLSLAATAGFGSFLSGLPSPLRARLEELTS
jgi:hypothetical protein